MKSETGAAALLASHELDLLLERAKIDTSDAVAIAHIPTAVAYFSELRAVVKDLQEKMSALQSHVDSLSQEILPTMFGNQDVKSIKIEGVGRVTINDRWSASMLNKGEGFDWLRKTNNEGLIIETVNSQTLGAFAKEEAIAKRPLPPEIFKVNSTPYTSITRG